MFIFHPISIVILIKIYLTTASPLVAPSRLLITRVGPCYGSKLPISISEMSITRKNFDFSISGQLNISVNVANGWIIKATMQKCHDIRNLDTCDHYKSLTVVKSGCDGEDEVDQLLQDKFFRYVTPRLGCPIQPGVYKISNYPFLTEDSDLTAAESKISTSVFGYTYRLDGFDEDFQKILCVDVFLQLIYVRNHDWIGNQKVKTVKVPATNHIANNTADHKHENDEVDERDDTADDKNYISKQNDATDDGTADDNHSDHEEDDGGDTADVKNDVSKQSHATNDEAADDNHSDHEKDDGDEGAEIKNDDAKSDDATVRDDKVIEDDSSAEIKK